MVKVTTSHTHNLKLYTLHNRKKDVKKLK